MIPGLALQLSDFADEFVSGHGNEELDELFGFLQLILAQSGAEKKTGQDGLTNILGIEVAAKPAVAKAKADFPTNLRLVHAHQLFGGPVVAGSYLLDEREESLIVHGREIKTSLQY
jgi:hypothetical protein